MPASKKAERLKQRAMATVRAPKPAGLLEPPPPRRRYRVIAVSLYTPELEWIDHATTLLRIAGHAKANRSLVVREAIQRLKEGTWKLNPQQLLHDFMARQSARQARALGGPA
jgi:hypothetical protein